MMRVSPSKQLALREILLRHLLAYYLADHGGESYRRASQLRCSGLGSKFLASVMLIGSGRVRRMNTIFESLLKFLHFCHGSCNSSLAFSPERGSQNA